jgi:lipid-binding SYLF domain-containing protein
LREPPARQNGSMPEGANVMTRFSICLGASLLLISAAVPLRAGGQELRTVASAAETLHAFSEISFRSIPPALMQDAKGVAIIPHVVKAGFVVGGRFGRGVLSIRQPDGTWSNPLFVTLGGGSIGWQIGIQSTDLILIFKTTPSLNRILRGRGKLTLGGDVAVAAGPVGRQAEAATDVQLRAEIYSYSRSRGLFAGISLEGAALLVDAGANSTFYGVPEGSPAEVLALRGIAVPVEVVHLHQELAKLSMSPPPVIVTPPPPTLPAPRPERP